MARTSDEQARSAERTIVYLARHGQTALNSSGVLRGLADPPLDETGQEQARQLGASLGSRNLSLVAASPLRRRWRPRDRSRCGGRAVVAVSHDAVNRQVLAALDPGLGDPDAIAQDNGCFNTLELRDGTWSVLAVNQVPPDLPHLPPG